MSWKVDVVVTGGTSALPARGGRRCWRAAPPATMPKTHGAGCARRPIGSTCLRIDVAANAGRHLRLPRPWA
jgi:hypothetical protein